MIRTLGTLTTALVLAGPLAAQAPPAPAAQPALLQPELANLRAQYAWGYAGPDGQGKGTLNVLLEQASGRTIVELHGLGERLMVLEGDRAAGYRVQIPRRQVDERAATLAAIPLPFFPQLTGPDALYRLLTDGAGPGVKVTRRDAQGPVKLRYQGNDDKGKEVMVWLERKRWETWTPKPE